MRPLIDGSVYPDEPAPTEFVSLAQKADYFHRIVSAFDFGVPPDAATLRLFHHWREVFDAHPLPHSPGYHALRAYFGWPEIPKEPFCRVPAYLEQDAREGRSEDCEPMV